MTQKTYTVDEIIGKTMEAFLASGMKLSTFMNSYYSTYSKMKTYFHNRGEKVFSHSVAFDFLEYEAEKMRQGELSLNYFQKIRLAINRMVHYVDTGNIYSYKYIQKNLRFCSANITKTS